VPVIVLLADGVRPDTLADALAATGDAKADLPAMRRLREEGGLFTVSSCFPSVTGPAYAPFLMGRYPGPIGLPGLRWFDRSRAVCSFPDFTRSYVGYQMGLVDRDIDPAAPTIFELCPRSVGALSVITRGLAAEQRIGGIDFGRLRSLGGVFRAARTHFTGNVAGWLDIDREVSDLVTRHIRESQPDYAFAALTGVDKTSHARGHESQLVAEALRIVDETVARIREDAERQGTWHETHLWVSSDHGHSSVREHDDLVEAVEGLGLRVVSHPWVFSIAPDVAVMVSGNAMAHMYVELDRRTRPFWSTLRSRWKSLAGALTARPSVDLLLLPSSEHACEVRSRERGTAMVHREGERYRYQRLTGDPLIIGRDLELVSATEAHEVTFDTDYPDSIVQIAHIGGASRSGDMILAAARDWDFRARYEPIPHVSSHGALHREHMLVPLLVNRPITRTPLRTVDLMPSALVALGLPVPSGLDGQSFIDSRDHASRRSFENGGIRSL
jgi:arylsulfatase A-like enzyme